ncbi:hypothetical protein Patl1_05466 [Pistacia atlantica]|uniref:Uncharacterized protein n=1 Tax=Pistacia atlantica TaxID=434234 RepID=A0ACC1BX94_9ROSI|nr:hypothetical protein Patl1_05466 [Pistacia atlantica]
MQNHEESGASCEFEDWGNFGDEDIMNQQSEIRAEEAQKVPFVADKFQKRCGAVPEPLSALASEYQSGSPILLEKIKMLGEQYAAIRRTRGDGNCFFRSFMFSYLEYILESQDRAEVDRVKANVEECRKTLQSLGYADFTFEDFFALIVVTIIFSKFVIDLSLASELAFLGSYSLGSWKAFFKEMNPPLGVEISQYLTMVSEFINLNASFCIHILSPDTFGWSVVMFFRFVASGEIRKRSEFFEPFVLGLTNATVEQFCKSSVEPMGEESDHVHITALSDALSVPIRVVYLDRSSCDTAGVSVNHHDFIPSGNLPKAASGSTEVISPFITLLYRPGHYDILYPK